MNTNTNNANTPAAPVLKSIRKLDVDWGPEVTTATPQPAVTVAQPEPEPEITATDRADQWKADTDWSGGAGPDWDAGQRLEHLKEDQNAANTAGFNLKAPVYALGTAVIDLGVENASKSRRDFEEMDSVNLTLEKLCNRIASEKREDVFMDMNLAHMTASGHVGRPGEHFGVNEQSFRHLCDLNGFNIGARYLWEECPVPLRALNINHQLANRKLQREMAHMKAVDLKEHAERYEANLAHLSEDDREQAMFSRFNVNKAKKLTIPDRSLTLRLRTRLSRHANPAVPRDIFAVTSQTYTPIDFTSIAAVIAGAINHGDARASFDYFYDKAAGVVDIMFHSDVKASNYSAGEIFKAFVRVKFDDARQGSVKVTAGLWRNLCLNLIILDVSEIDCGRIIHTGSHEGRIEAINKAVNKALGSIDHFVTKWDKASAQLITNPSVLVKNARGSEAEAKSWADCNTIERVAGLVNGYTKVNALPPLSRPIIAGIANAYARDALTGGSDITKAGVINAITRYANDDMDRWSADALERAAGGLTWNDRVQPVFQYVNVLAA